MKLKQHGGWREGAGRKKTGTKSKIIRVDDRLITLVETLKERLKSGAINDEDLKKISNLMKQKEHSMELPEDLLSSDIRNNSFVFLTLEQQESIDLNNVTSQDLLCMAYQNGKIEKNELEEEIEKEKFQYPVSIFDDDIQYETSEELFSAITSKEVDDGEGNFKPESQEDNDDN